MDGRRFDLMTKAVTAKGRSRRSVVKGLAAALVGAAAVGHATGDASAAAVCRVKSEICRKGGDCCSNLCGAADSTGRRRCVCPTTTVFVAANNPNPINTGVFVQPGDTVTITATGQGSWCCNALFDANGQAPCGFLGIPFNCGSLVGTVGPGNIFTDYTVFTEIGTGATISPTASGNLTLQYVDGCPGCYGDNIGGLTVTIEVCGAGTL